MAKQIVTSNLAQQIYRKLKEMILVGELRVGERISLEILGREFGVSSTPIREALAHLVNENLVRFEPRRGYYVAKPTIQHIENAFEVRIVFEAYAVPFAIEFAKKNGQPWNGLLRELARLRTPKERSTLDFANELDHRLHRLLVDSICNPFLTKLWSYARNATVIAFQLANETYLGTQEHIAIIEAILRGDAEHGQNAVCTHLINAKEHLIKQIQLSEGRSGSDGGSASNAVSKTFGLEGL